MVKVIYATAASYLYIFILISAFLKAADHMSLIKFRFKFHDTYQISLNNKSPFLNNTVFSYISE